ncbi:unnamed protein product, partial [Brassica oleracea var. botrytis]
MASSCLRVDGGEVCGFLRLGNDIDARHFLLWFVFDSGVCGRGTSPT